MESGRQESNCPDASTSPLWSVKEVGWVMIRIGCCSFAVPCNILMALSEGVPTTVTALQTEHPSGAGETSRMTRSSAMSRPMASETMSKLSRASFPLIATLETAFFGLLGLISFRNLQEVEVQLVKARLQWNSGA